MVQTLGWTFPGSPAVYQSQFTLKEWRLERLCESVSDGDTPKVVVETKLEERRAYPSRFLMRYPARRCSDQRHRAILRMQDIVRPVVSPTVLPNHAGNRLRGHDERAGELGIEAHQTSPPSEPW